MDIQKEREAFLHEFEKTEQYRQQYGFYKIPLKYDEQKETWNFYDVQAAWEMWQAAKAQAVPETQQALNDRLLVKSIREHVESHIAEIGVNDLFDKGWLAAMRCIQNNIDMLEAREPAND